MTKNQKRIIVVAATGVVAYLLLSGNKMRLDGPKPRTRAQKRRELGDKFIAYIKSFFK